MIDNQLIEQTKQFISNGDKDVLTTLGEADRNDITAHSIVRYLIQIKKWKFTDCELSSNAINKLFEAHPDREAVDPELYRETTAKLIKEAFDYDCVYVEPEEVDESSPVAPAKGKKTKGSKQTPDESSESTIDTHMGIVDISDADKRLQEVIKIQRGE